MTNEEIINQLHETKKVIGIHNAIKNAINQARKDEMQRIADALPSNKEIEINERMFSNTFGEQFLGNGIKARNEFAKYMRDKIKKLLNNEK